MGQSASKAAEAAKRAAAPHISQTIRQTQPRTPPAAAEAASQWSATSAGGGRRRGGDGGVGEYSPTRGQRHEAETAAAIAAAASSSSDVMPEMPPDLIKFLNDAGPLQRTVDKELTSAKVYDALVKDENAQDEQARQANRRVRRKMPIMSSHNSGDEGENDGTMTERTTNFSTTDRSKGKSMGLGVTREDLFRLSHKVEEFKVETPEWKKAMEDEYRGIAKGASESKNFDQLKDKTLFENSLKYIGVPVLMKDAEGDIVGLWSHKAEDMKFGLGLKELPERSVQFAMLNEGNVAESRG